MKLWKSKWIFGNKERGTWFRVNFGGIKIVLSKSLKSIFLMNKRERILALILSIILAFLIILKIYEVCNKDRVLVPSYGGVYREISFGEIKYINPIIAKSDIERSISRLIYSGLIKIDEKGEIAPDLAESYSISESGLEYDFVLKQGVFFSNGEEFEIGRASCRERV